MADAVSVPKFRFLSLFWIFIFLNIVFVIMMTIYLRPLSFGDLLKFETAKTLSRSENIITEWKLTGKYDKAIESIWVEYPFIVLYVAGLMLSVLCLSHLTHYPLLMSAGTFFCWLIPIAGICDVIENIFMMQSLQHGASRFTFLVTYNLAVAKFSILIISVLYLLVCFLFWILRKAFE